MASKHICHAIGCTQEVFPRLLMCGRHWRLVPLPTQRAVWQHYRAGQEVDKRPSQEYMAAARDAIDAVAKAEAKRKPGVRQIGLFEPHPTYTQGSK